MTSNLNPRHAEILREMVAHSYGECEGDNSGNPGTAPVPTLRAMERRGLVEVHLRKEASGWAGPKNMYRVAVITDEGRAAIGEDPS